MSLLIALALFLTPNFVKAQSEECRANSWQMQVLQNCTTGGMAGAVHGEFIRSKEVGAFHLCYNKFVRIYKPSEKGNPNINQTTFRVLSDEGEDFAAWEFVPDAKTFDSKENVKLKLGDFVANCYSEQARTDEQGTCSNAPMVYEVTKDGQTKLITNANEVKAYESTAFQKSKVKNPSDSMKQILEQIGAKLKQQKKFKSADFENTAPYNCMEALDSAKSEQSVATLLRDLTNTPIAQAYRLSVDQRKGNQLSTDDQRIPAQEGGKAAKETEQYN